ncbi:MAG TPA: ATP-binding protein [Candidatus Polarisedimenticolia bacterium]|nr:ATP-binding protein [Candidatus Polarisedimenticolia bacterium]
MGETRVDLLHLLEDLRDAYTGPLEETILTELVANSLDSGATLIMLSIDLNRATLTLADNGSGMKGPELTRFHDIAASTKVKGEGIGFAGVGVKLALLASEEVLTETRRGKSHVATTWHLASRYRAPWKRLPPPGLAGERGTAVRLKLKNPLSPLLDGGFAESVMERHYAPLFDPAFAEILKARYPSGVQVQIDGRPVRPRTAPGEPSPISVRMRRKRKPEGWGYLVRSGSLPEDQRGLAISTLGKVIKRGWEWLGVAPSVPTEVGGLIEVPALAACLALSKTEFIRSGARGAIFLQHRKAIQEAVSSQLQVWGEARDKAEEEQRRRVRPLERDLEKVLIDLADEFPLLSSLVERQAGGQRRLPVGSGGGIRPGSSPAAVPEALVVAPQVPADSGQEELSAPPVPAATPAPPSIAQSQAAPGSESGQIPEGLLQTAARRRKQSAHYALGIELESRPDDPQLGRLVESSVRVNTAHPAYRRAETSRSLGYHLALSVAMALAPLAVEPEKSHDFVTSFLTHWGEAVDHPGRRPHRRRLRSGAAHAR